MKLPSLLSLWQGMLTVIKRFPIQFILVIVAIVTALAMVEAEHKNALLFSSLAKLLALCNITVVFLLATDLYAETERLSNSIKNVLRIGILIVSCLLFFLLDPEIYRVHFYQLLLLAIIGHLLVAFLPFIKKDLSNGFWQYNKTLFLRFITSVLYSFVLFAGLAIALFAVNNLFALQWDGDYYLRLFLLIAIGFNTIFFLAGIPPEIRVLEKQQDYPKGLKIFTQYVLIPLMSIYLIILLIYEIKIILNWQLPKGLVSNLIIGYAFFGILSLLLINPIKNSEGNTWIRLFSRFFYLMMIPLLVLLLLAIYKRVGNYGITEPRYFLIAIACWLIFITIYFLLRKEPNIKIIPFSLCIVVMLSCYGPQGAFHISRISQKNRLKEITAKHPNDGDYEKASIVRYLVSNHGLTSLQDFTNTDLKKIVGSIDAHRDSISNYRLEERKIDTAYKLLAINPNKIYPSNSVNYSVGIKNDQVAEVQGWDYIIRLENYQIRVDASLGKDSVFIQKDNSSKECSVKIAKNSYTFKLDSIYTIVQKAFDTKTLAVANSANNMFYFPQEKMQLTSSIGSYQVQFSFLKIDINKYQKKQSKEDLNINFSANILLRKLTK